MFDSNDNGCLFMVIVLFIFAAAIGIGCWELAKYMFQHLHLAWN